MRAEVHLPEATYDEKFAVGVGTVVLASLLWLVGLICMVGRVIITFVNFYFMCLLFLMHWEQHGGLHCPLKLAEGLSSFHSAYSP